MNTELRENANTNFEKDFLNLMHNAFFGNTVHIVRKHRDIKLVSSEEKKTV